MLGSLKLVMEVVFPPAEREVLTHSTISASLMGLLEPASFCRTESVYALISCHTTAATSERVEREGKGHMREEQGNAKEREGG